MNSIKPAKKRFPYTFQQCISKMEDFKTGRQYMTSRLQPNTYMLREEMGYSITLHGTKIIKLYSDDSLELSEGEWHSPTTFARLSNYCPLPIRQKGKKWVIMLKDFTEVEFRNGMRINKQGDLLYYPA